MVNGYKLKKFLVTPNRLGEAETLLTKNQQPTTINHSSNNQYAI